MTYPAGMSGIPTRRLFVYILAGLVVLGVGTAAVVSMSAGDPREAVSLSSAEPGMVSGMTGGQGQLDPAAAATAAGEVPSQSSAVAGEATTTTEEARIYVQVAGAVARPGVYEMPADSRVFQAIQKAGGFLEDADQEAVTLASRLSDGCRVYAPREGEPPGDVALAPQGETGNGSSATAATQAGSTGPVSLNSANAEELDALPGVGPAIARDIITYREANGPFTSIEQLTDVPGIGPSKLEQLRPLVGL